MGYIINTHFILQDTANKTRKKIIYIINYFIYDLFCFNFVSEKFIFSSAS